MSNGRYEDLTRRGALASLGALMALGMMRAGAWAAEPPLELKWDNLVPPAPPKPPKPFFSGRPVDIGRIGAPDDGTPAPPPVPEGRWMSTPRASSSTPAPVVAGLDGKRVHIGGYVVPLDFDATRISEFLLVPFVGACIHVPPPPANQIVYVKAQQAFEIKATFDPVWVTGTLKVVPAFTGIADAGYSLEAEKVEARAQ
jgi:hypothetical protein